MNIELNEKELKTFVELLDIADTVLTSFEVDLNRKEKKPYIKLIQKLYRLAQQNGLEKWFEERKEVGELFLGEEYEKVAQAPDLIEEYEEAVFWEMLETELAHRDLEEKHDKSEFEKDPYEALEYVLKYQEVYRHEFEKSGIQNMRLVKDSAKKK
ncbi:MAG TPA: hypothetical protein PKO06_12890 [Candidatus Ozemobacteraceae bacterium]|nr:hypothetical protein [Candidatus Ozemobacteraceae bacterium]